MGEMTESYDCEGNEIKVEYDILGRKTALESRDSGRYIYEYNGEGKLQYESNSRLIAEGKRIGYFYDSFGRLSKIDYPDAKETVYEYGSPDTGEENARGRLVRVSDSSGVMEYVYGDLGEVKEEKRTLSQKHNATLPDMTAVTKFESNYLGQMESITYPDNEVVSYAYDDAGQVVSVRGKNDHDTFNYVDMIGYDEFGQRIYMKYGNGVETTYEYKEEKRLLESIRTENESRQLLQNIKYSFDAVGNIEGYVNDCKGMGNYETRQSYKYDSLYQLTGVNGFTDFNRHNISGTSTFRSNYSQTYEFNSIGNMKLKKSEEVIRTGTKTGDDLNYELNYVKDPLYAHRFISIGDRYYKYDEVGNVIGEQTGPYSEDQEESELIKSYGDSIYGVETAWGFYGDDEEADIRRAKKYHREYEWDERNQLIRIKDNNTEVMFVYGQDGKRTNKYTIDTETLYFNNYWSYYIDPSVNSCGGKVSRHIFLGETRLATSINSYNNVGTGYHGEEKDHIYFYHSDHLGSAQLVTDWQGYEYQRIEYTPYGESWVDIKIMGAASVMPLSYKFSARERDEETGLYYYGARYLDPKYSKWLSTDPALGDYIPGAGKGNAQDSGKLPGMGGIFNHINFNLYHYAGNNPVKYTDPDGRIAVIGAIAVWGFNAVLFGYGLVASRKDENGFSAKHPIIAIQLGYPKDGGRYGINSAASNFAINSKLSTSTFSGISNLDEGSKKGAYRHAVWQAIICSKFGTELAMEVGNSHDPITPKAQASFSSLADADTYCDQMNNVIGRNIGKDSNLSSKELALKTLDVFYDSGLYTVSQNTDGTYSVSLTTLSSTEYETAYSELLKRNNQGLLK